MATTRPFTLLLLLAALLQACSGSSKGAAANPIDPTTKGLDVLGLGTDVFGYYATEDNKKGRVLDVTAMNAAGLIVYSPDVQESRFEEAGGETISEYASSLATSLDVTGSYMWFSGEIQAAYAQDTYRRTGFSYASIRERHWKHAVKVEPGLWTSPARLRPYLTTLARQALDDTDSTRTWTGAQVIASFGTHVLNGIYVGGRLDYNLTVQIQDVQYQQTLSAYARASFDASFSSAGITFSLDETSRAALDSYQKLVTTSAKGGNSQYAQPTSDTDYQLWKASLDTNPVYCGIIKDGLLGIWELAGTPARQEAIRLAFEAYGASQDAAFVPLVSKITDVRMVDAGQSTSVTLDPGYRLLRSSAGTTADGSFNGPLWTDAVQANHVYLAYRQELTATATGLAEIHVSSSVPGVRDLLFGGAGGAGHDARYGADQPGCTANAGVDLNAGTCSSAGLSENDYCWGNAIWLWSASCAGGGTPLSLHHEMETATRGALRCLVLGDATAIDSNQAMATRVQHIHWGPEDANQDGTSDLRDAEWVLRNVRWVKAVPSDAPVNVNMGTQSYCRYNYSPYCGGYDDAWMHAANAIEDAKYVGYCPP